MWRSVASAAGSRPCGPEGGGIDRGGGAGGFEEEVEEAADDDDETSAPPGLASSLALDLFAFWSGPEVDRGSLSLALVRLRA